MFVSVLLFFVGFYILVKGANFLVDGSVSLARKFDISSLLIGLVIVGIGTSIPEFAISFIANIVGEGDIGLGTIIGSNTFNILFILGISALFFPFFLKPAWVRRDLIWNMIAILVVIFFVTLWGKGIISQLEGLFMLFLFSFWLYRAIKKSNKAEEEHMEFKELTLSFAAVFILAGFVGTILGGKWVVDGATVIAREFGMSEAFIGLIIVGLGTSLPELATSFVAVSKRQSGIAVGTIIGSNIFDFLMILGIGALVKPILFPSYFLPDIIITFLSAALLFGAMFVGKVCTLKRWQGLIFVSLYILYAFYIIIRG